MAYGPDAVSTALRRAADSVSDDAATIRLSDVMHLKSSRVLPRRGRNVRIAWAVAIMALVAAVVVPVSLAGTASESGSPNVHGSEATERIPVGSLNRLVLVGMGGRSGDGSSPNAVDVIDPVTGTVTDYTMGLAGDTSFPWVVEGDTKILVSDRPSQSSIYVEGKTFAFRPDQPSMPPWSLGAASDVIPSVTPGDVWIVTAPTGNKGIPPSGGPEGQGCAIREETVNGRNLTPEYPLDCRRWIVAAVNGGLLSVPGVENADSLTYEASLGTSPSTDFALQVWDPHGGTIERTVTDHASFVLQASDQYVEWQDRTEFNGNRSV